MTRLVSVVVPAYNRERTLGATLSSILTQTYPHVEAVVVDDGSSDRTVAIARSYDPERVRVVEQVNAGPAAARNAAVAAARGELIATCDSDDILLPNHVTQAVETLDSAPFPRFAVACNAFISGPAGLDTGRTLRHGKDPGLADQRLAMLQANWASYLMLAPRRLFEETGGYDPAMRSSEDWDLWVRALFGGWSIVRQPTPTALYAWTPDSLSTDRATMTATEDLVVRRALERFGPQMALRERAYCERRLAEGSPMDLANRADRALESGDRVTGAALLRQASSLNPRETKLAAKARVSRLPGGPHLLAWHARRSAATRLKDGR
ncbi:glycosyltransferase family 2 protein [Arsenicicoccus piscis]|uniref:Glycosyltransferase 2-like domain-containing protein n=1 Tax=Arsenicicoccus piscis TaxID=673954 RepID=A0ABQ6HQ36_9MICO|nr:glycosyltransferase family A protein [Arsenicicoccus piscis]MCH8628052.1 glycosyltransferase family 2 protein [Arsenicicoccus piscis]GMA20589.1 hypothetical protein GCM10025862_26100 [Arsenicicoccus piscis]